MKTQRVVMVALALALMWTASAVAQQTAEERYQAGLYQEEVQGNLEQAIEIYQSILSDFPNNRAVGAKAQLHIGICYETLGMREAQRAYQRVVANYGDQSEVVRQARARLAALSQQTRAAASIGPVARMLFSDEDTDLNNFFDMKVSPDGRYVAYTQMGSDGALYIRDLVTGDTTRLADGWNIMPVWSADGRRIVYSHAVAFRPPEVELTIIDVVTRETSHVSAIEGVNAAPFAWSPDGHYLACGLFDENQNASFVLVSLANGDTTSLGNTWRPVGADFSPDSRFLTFTSVVDENKDIYVVNVESGERYRITTGPEDDTFPLWSPEGDAIVYSNDNGSWVRTIENGAPSGPDRLLTADEYGQAAGWTDDGVFHFVKYNTVRRAYRIPIDPQTMTTSGPPELLPLSPVRVAGFAWSPDTKTLAGSAAGTAIEISSADEAGIKSFETPVNSRLQNLWWSGDGSEVYFTEVWRSKPREGQTIYALNHETGTVRELFPRLYPGYRFRTSFDGQKMVYYRWGRDGQGMQLVVADIGSADGVVLFDAAREERSLASWVRPQFSPDGSMVLYGTMADMPTEEHDGHDLWVVSADGSNPRMVAAAHWIPYAAWDPSSTKIVYNVWQDEESAGDLFVVDLESGQQHELSIPPGLGSMAVRQWSPDGKWIGVTIETGDYEYWAVDNVLGGK